MNKERRLHVMMVDDAATLRTLLKRTLYGIDHSLSIVEFGNGDDAIAYYEPGKVDIVFLDINMPGKDGIEVLTELKSRDPDIYVVMVTANRTNDWVIKAKKAGANGYIAKPFTSDKLTRVLDDSVRYKLLRSGKAQPRRMQA